MGMIANLVARRRKRKDEKEKMRTSIPHGMSQENRVHPLFIILRKHSEEEERLFRKLVRVTIWTTIINLLAVALSALWSVSRCPMMVIVASGTAITTVLFMCEQYRTILHFVNREWLVFPKVNRMLFSDDYSSSILNYENVVNMIGEVRSTMSTLHCKITDTYRNLIYTLIILGVAALAHILSGGVF